MKQTFFAFIDELNEETAVNFEVFVLPAAAEVAKETNSRVLLYLF
jgi:hypothetical protein